MTLFLYFLLVLKFCRRRDFRKSLQQVSEGITTDSTWKSAETLVSVCLMQFYCGIIAGLVLSHSWDNCFLLLFLFIVGVVRSYQFDSVSRHFVNWPLYVSKPKKSMARITFSSRSCKVNKSIARISFLPRSFLHVYETGSLGIMCSWNYWTGKIDIDHCLMYHRPIFVE